jgi:small conductance mechanosensitive channel
MAGPFDLGLPIQLTIITDILQVVIILVLTYIIVRIFRVVVRRLGGTVPSGLVASFQQIGSWAIWTIGIIVILSQLQINTTILLLILGLGGIAVIVAYQGILGDIGAAQFISNYQAFKVGEWIEVEHHNGRVIERNLIHTKIVTPDNEIVVIPNSLLLKHSVINRTRSGGLRVQVPVFVRAGVDLKTLENRLVEIGGEMKVDLVPESSPQVRLVELNRDTARFVLMLNISNPSKRDQIISDVQRRVYEVMPELDEWKRPD